ncbi:uncharacterized protein UHOD_12292 [Ustilago sp. UG-2017b]|nr:uncharacterized protein UHOD_12292 [Ustilago sp. UG-2017b]
MIDSTCTELRSTQTHWFGHCTHCTILILDEIIHSNLIIFIIDENVATICLVKTMEAAEAKETSNFTKQVKPGITYLAPAATNMATAETIAERKATSNSALMGTIHNARRWLLHTPMEGVPEDQLTPTCQSHLARDQPQQPTCPPQQHPHPTWRPCHNRRPLEQRTITALEAALSDPIDLLMDPGSTISMLPALRMEAIMTRPGLCVHKVVGEPIVYSMPCDSKPNVQLTLLDDIKVNVLTNQGTGFTYECCDQLCLCDLPQPAMQSLNTQKLSKLERYLAARWSAKEAAYKALYPRHGFSWKDLSDQKPGTNVDNAVPIVSIDLAQLKLQGFCTKKTEHSLSDEWRSKHSVMSSIPKQHLSLSHDGEYVAFRMLVSKEPHRMNIDKLKGLITKDRWSILDQEGVLKVTIQ